MSKSIDDFAWRRKRKGQRDNYCRPCRAAYKQEHYAKNRQRYIDNAAARRKPLIAERMRFVIAYLEQRGCSDCGERDPVILEFDHLEEKSFSISDGIRNRNWASVLAEIEKCDVVCANCHRRRTALRGGFVRSILAGNEE